LYFCIYGSRQKWREMLRKNVLSRVVHTISGVVRIQRSIFGFGLICQTVPHAIKIIFVDDTESVPLRVIARSAFGDAAIPNLCIMKNDIKF